MNKGTTIGELLEEARRKSGEPVLAGHDIIALERFGEDTRHMIRGAVKKLHKHFKKQQWI